MQSLSSQFATWIGVISAIAGGVFALQAYREDVSKRVDDRALGAFERIERFNAPEFRVLRDKVDAEAFARRICDVRPQPREFSINEVTAYVDFYDLVALCVDADLCDGPITERYFGRYANASWLTLEPFIERMRASAEARGGEAPPFGHGIERYAAEPTPLDDACEANFFGVLTWEEVGR